MSGFGRRATSDEVYKTSASRVGRIAILWPTWVESGIQADSFANADII